MSAQAAPTSEETNRFYELTNKVLLDIWGEEFHHGYWDSEEDRSTIREATARLTRLLVDKTDFRNATAMLDVGCGIGTPAFTVAEVADVQIVGISNNQEQLDEANRKAAERGLADRVRFEYADGVALPYADGSFDIVWIFEAIMHMDRPRALREAFRVLRPGGRLVVTDHLRTGPMSEADSELVRRHMESMHAGPLLDAKEYRALVREAGFELTELLDVSAHTQQTARRVIATVEKRHDELVERYGEEVVPVLKVFNSPVAYVRELGYLVTTARKRA
ncbi:SAM-dependent methyltransferase [Microbispora siamensis]